MYLLSGLEIIPPPFMEHPLTDPREPAVHPVSATPLSVKKDEAGLSWFVMRDLKRPNAKLPAYKQLAERSIEVFTPMSWRLVVRRGKRVREEVPFLPDLLFVHSQPSVLDPVVEDIPTLQYRYVRGGYRKLMTVDRADMERFIQAVRSSDSPRFYQPEELTPAMYGRMIRIEGGPLDGYEGRLLSLRGSRVKRLIVEIPGFLAAAVEVNPEYIQFI